MVFAGDIIRLVHDYPCLYDPSHMDFKNLAVREEAWEDIGAKVYHSGSEVKKKWRNLKDTYVKYLKSFKRQRQDQKSLKRWQWAIQMSAYHDYIISGSRSTASTLNSSEGEDKKPERGTPEMYMELEDTEFGEDPIGGENSDGSNHFNDTQSDTDNKGSIIEYLNLPSTSGVSMSTPPRLKRKLSITHEEIADPISSAANLVQDFQNPSRETDAIDLLFLAYARTLKTFSGKRQAIAKLKIAEVMSQQEILHHEDQEATGKERLNASE